MKIALASDHRGYNLKKELIKTLKKDYEILDLGTNSLTSVDFPKFGILLGETIRDKKADLGIAICGTGIGISIITNKVEDIMCAKIDSLKDAKLAKEHNHANVLALRGDLNKEEAIKMIETFLSSKHLQDEKYQRRIKEIKDYDNAR